MSPRASKIANIVFWITLVPVCVCYAEEPPPGLTPMMDQNGKFLVNFKNATVDVVVEELAKASGFSVMLVDKPNDQRIPDLMNVSGVTAEEAITLINVSLYQAGYVAIQQGRVLKIVRRSDAMTRDIPVRTFAAAADVPLTDELVTAVIPLRWASATQLQRDLIPLLDPGTVITSNASSNALIVTDVTSGIHRVMLIVEALDTHVTQASDVRLVTLNHASAADMAKLINEIYRERQTDTDAPPNAPDRGGDRGQPTRGGRGNRGATFQRGGPGQ